MRKGRKHVYIHEFFVKVTHTDKLTSRVRAEALREVVMQYLRKLPTFTGVQQVHPVMLIEAFTWASKLNEEELETAIAAAKTGASNFAFGDASKLTDEIIANIAVKIANDPEFQPKRKVVYLKKRQHSHSANHSEPISSVDDELEELDAAIKTARKVVHVKWRKNRVKRESSRTSS